MGALRGYFCHHKTASTCLGRLPRRRLPAGYLPWALDRFSFERLAGGRKRGEEDQGSHYRRGVAGDWRNHLTQRHLAAFRERFGDLTERLGYGV